MSGTHAVITSSASVDGTAGTFVELATNSPVPLQDGSKRFHGVVFSGAPLAQVAAKPASLRIKLTSSSLDIVGEIFTYGAGYGGGIATNGQQPYFPIDCLQFDVAAAGGEKCKAEVTVHTSGDTGAWSAIASWVSSDSDTPDADLTNFWGGDARPPVQGGDSNMASVTATTRTTLGDTQFGGKFSKAAYMTAEGFAVAVPAAGAAGSRPATHRSSAGKRRRGSTTSAAAAIARSSARRRPRRPSARSAAWATGRTPGGTRS